jgi:hypothetical protein
MLQKSDFAVVVVNYFNLQKYLAMEFAKLKDLENAKAFKKRSEKLQRKMQIALMPPSTRVYWTGFY